MANESTKWLYEQLKGKGYNVGKDVNEFDNLMRTNADSRQWAYDTATKSGFNVGKDIDEFSSLVGGTNHYDTHNPQRLHPSVSAIDDRPITNASTTTAHVPQGYHDEDGIFHPYPISDTATDTATSPVPQNTTGNEERQGGWQPSPVQKAAMIAEIHSGVNETIGNMRNSVENVRRLVESNSTEGRNKRKAAEMQARMVGTPTKVPGLTAGIKSSTTKDAPNEPGNPNSPIPYGVKMENGEAKTEWLLPDGTLSTSLIDADKAEFGARKARLQHEFVKRMEENGLDPAKESDIEEQRKKDLLDVAEIQTESRLAENEEHLHKLYDKRAGELDQQREWDDDEGFWSNFVRIVGGTANSTTTINAPKQQSSTIEDKEIGTYMAENQILTDARKLLETRKLNKSYGFMGGFWNIGNNWRNMKMGAKHTLSDSDYYLNGVMALQKASRLMEIEDKLKQGAELTDAEVSLVYSTALGQVVQNNTDTPHGYTVAQIELEMFPFMAQMALNPASGLSRAMVTKFGKSGLRKIAMKKAAHGLTEEAAAQFAKRETRKLAAKAVGVQVAGDVAESAVLANTLQGAKTAADAMERYQGNVVINDNGIITFDGNHNWAEAIYKAEASATIENYTEMLGEHFGIIGNALGKGAGKGLRAIGGGKVVDTVSDMIAKIGTNEWGKAISAVEKRAHWNGTVGEVLEEEAGIVLNSIFTGDNKISDLWDADQQIDIVLGVGLFGGFVSGLKTVGYPIGKSKAKGNLRKSDSIGAWRFGDGWTYIRDEINNAEEKDLGNVVRDLVRGHAKSDEQGKAIVEYAHALMNSRGYEIASASARSEGTSSPEQQDIEESFEHGEHLAETEDSQEMGDAKRMLDLQRQRLASALSEDVVHDFDTDPIGALSRTHDPDTRLIAADYVNAKAVYDGMIQRVRDDIDGRIAQSDAMIDGRVNRTTGMIQPATMRSDGKETQVYVVDGELAMFEDGSGIDTQNSSESIIIRDAETGKIEFADPTRFVSVDNGIDAETEKEAVRQQIRQEVAQAAANKIDGVLSFSPGDTYNVLDMDGQPQEVSIVGQPVDENGVPVEGLINIQYPDGQIQQVAMSDLQQQVDAANAQRVENFVSGNAETVPYIAENAENLTENGENITENVLKTAENIENLQQSSQSPISENPVKPVGTGMFGNIFNAFKQKAKEAAAFLYKLKGGEAQDVFTRDEIGGISLVWGDETKGLQHIIRKHIVEHSDFESVSEMIESLNDVIPNGDIIIQKGGNYRIEKDGYRAIIAKSDDGGFVLTAYDKTRTQDDKKRSDADAALFDQRVSEEMNGTLVSSDTAPVSKDNATEGDLQASALSRIPVDDNGGYRFDAVDPETAWDGMVEFMENEDDASEYAAAMVGESEAAVKKAGQAITKVKPTNDPAKFKADKAAARSALSEAQRQMEHWQNVVGVASSRRAAIEEAARQQAEAERASQIAAEARREAELQAEARRKAEEDAAAPREYAKAYAGWEQPATFEEYVLRRLSAGGMKLKWAKNERTGTNGLGAMLGYGSGTREQQGLLWLLDNANGYYPEEAAERMLVDFKAETGMEPNIDAMDAHNTLLDVIATHGTSRAMWAEAKRRHDAMEATAPVDEEYERQREWYETCFGMSPEEYESYEEQVYSDIAAHEISEDEMSDFIATFADAILTEQKEREEYERNREHDNSAAGSLRERGDGILPEEQPDIAAGDNPPVQRTQEADGNGNRPNGGTPQEKLSKEDAADIIAKMEMSAVDDPRIALSPESWLQSFGLNNSIETPMGKVKMGDGQYQKFVDKKRSNEFGMVVQTLQDPDIVFIEPSEAKERQIAERNFSYVFVKTFIRDGKKLKYYTSVSILKDGLEVSVSSHIASKSAIIKKLESMERAYTKESLFPNSSEWHLAEHPTDVPDLLPTQGKSETIDNPTLTDANHLVTPISDLSEVSEDKITESSVEKQTESAESSMNERIAAAEAEVNTNPTDAQKSAGNYKKGHVQVGTFDVTIENPAGSVRSGVDADGKQRSNTMHNTYGYIRGTVGVDGDHIDVYLSSDIDGWNGRRVFVMDVYNPDGTFDEHKVMLGFNEKEEAAFDFAANYDMNWVKSHRIEVHSVTLDDFEKWIDSSKRKTKPFGEYAIARKSDEKSFSIGDGMPQENRAVYDATVRMLRDAGIKVHEVSGDEAQAMLREKITPVAGLPNRANEKQSSGSMLQRAMGDSSSKAPNSVEAGAKIENNTQSAKNNINKFHNGDFMGGKMDVSTLDKALSALGRMLSMRSNGGSRYTLLHTEGGAVVAMRLSDHRANGNNFKRDNADRNLSIVIERKMFDTPDSEIEFTEAVIPMPVFEAHPHEVVSAIVKGVEDVLADKPFTLDGSLGSVTGHSEESPQFHIRTYHGTGAEFDRFDFSHMGSGEGVQAYGWGGYVTEVKGIGKGYATAIGGKELIPKIEKVTGNISQVREWLRENEDYDKYARRGSRHLKELQREYRSAEKDGNEKDMTFYKGLIDLQENALTPESHAALIADKQSQIDGYQKELDGLNAQMAQRRHLYTVSIPDDTGGNYLDWGSKIPDEIKNKIILQAAVDGVSLDFYGEQMSAADYFSRMGEDAVGFQLYRALTRALGSDKAASGMLSRAGLTGIKYAADHNNGGRADGKKNYTIFNEGEMKIMNHVQFMSDREGDVYGWTVGGEVFLNRDAINPETPLHEYTHLWDAMVKECNPELWERGVELMRQTPIWDEVVNDPNYSGIREDEDAIASEVHSRLTGRDGAALLSRMIEESRGKGAFAVAERVTLVERLKEWLRDMFNAIKETLGKWTKSDLERLTPEQFSQMPLRDLAEGLNPTAESHNHKSNDNPDISETNARFNEQLQQQIDGTLPKGHVYQIGKPGTILRCAGIKDLPIELSSTRLATKSSENYRNSHPYPLEAIKNLPLALNAPIAVFNSKTVPDAKVILTELQHNGNNFIAALQIKTGRGRQLVEVNSIRSLYPKESVNGILGWINDGLMKWVDKDKMKNFLSIQWPNHIADGKEVNPSPAYPSSTSQSVQQEIDKQELEDAANIIKGFENPTIEGDEISERSGEGAYTDEELSMANDPWSKAWGESLRTKRQQKEFAARERKRMAERVKELTERLHLDNVEVVTDPSTLSGKRATAKGFFNNRTGKITIVLPNNSSATDIEQTLLHEAVAHYGLRQLLGNHFDEFLDKVYEAADETIKARIDVLAIRNGWNRRVATEEYMAALAEDADFDRAEERIGGWFSKIKHFFIDMLRKVGFKNISPYSLRDNELRYILWRSYQNLANPGRYRAFEWEAEDVAMQYGLSVGEYAPHDAITESRVAEAGELDEINERFNEQLQQQIDGTLPKGHVYDLGKPSIYLKSTGIAELPIRLSAKTLNIKSNDPLHGYSLSEIKGLVEAIQKPWAIFSYGDKAKMQNLIVGIESNGKQFLVGISINPTVKGHELEINSIRNVFPKDNHEWVNWINEGKLLRVDKKAKIQAVIAKLRINPVAFSYVDLDSAAKIVERFENPTINEHNNNVEDDGDVRFRDGDFTPRDRKLAAAQYERMLSRGSWQFKEAVQDSMLGLKTLYESILGKDTRIEDVAGYENAYLYENRMSSTNNGEQHQYFIQYMKPLLDSIYELCGNDKLDRRILTDYMMAKHGLERNEKMRVEAAAKKEDTDRDFAGLCGLTGEDSWISAETEAQKMVDEYERNHDTTKLWENVRKATNATLEKIYLSGLISEDTFNKVQGMYDFYIPLRGWDETTSNEVYGYLTSNDGPLTGNVFKKATGRKSKADDPIATIAMMADDAIRQGNRNIMKQRFLNFVHGNPSDLVSINDMWLQHDDVTDEWKPVFAELKPDMTHEEVESEVAKFEAKMERLKKSEPDKYARGNDARNILYKVVNNNLREHQVLVKRNGRTYVMTINGNPRAAQALNGLTNPDVEMGGIVGNLLKGAEYVNRNLSAFYTTRNPDFVVSNFMRDTLYSNCMAWVKESPSYALRFHKNFGKVNPVILGHLLHKWENGTLDDSNKLERMFKEFMLNGGETGYTSVKDIEGHKRTIASELKKHGNIGRKAWSALGMQLDLLNRSAENCARFAAFLTSREMGRTLDRSIYDAKEVSVNFNKKGSGGKFVNATGQTTLGKIGASISGSGRILYVFWNAGIQGMTNFGRAAKRHPGKAALGGAAALFTLGYVIPLLAQMCGSGDGDDDKNAYYNLPEHIRRSNICFHIGDQWITIPLPIEYRAIYGMGELACGVISGNERYSNSELFYHMAAQVSQAMPLDILEGDGGFSAFIPSAVKPVTEAYVMNKSWSGLPIYKDTPFNKNDPEWTKAYQSADQHLVAFTKWLNETSGGDDYKKGAIDINPAKIEYLLSGTFGGVFTTFENLKKTGETIIGKREFEWRNTPIANRIVKSGDERTANRKLQNEYFKYFEEYEETKRLYRKYDNAAANGILGYAEKANFLYNSPEYLRLEKFEEYKPEMDAFRTQLKEETDPEKKKEIQAEMFGTMRKLVDSLRMVGQ